MAKEELIVKFLAGEADKHEVNLLMSWRKASEANELQYKEIEKIWLNSSLEEVHNYQADEAWIKVSEKIDAIKERKWIVLRPTWLIAASIALLLACTLWLFQTKDENQISFLSLTSDTMTQMKLQDGSQITLLSGSLHYPKEFSKKDRHLKLDSGTVFFKIAKDQTRPFIIEANQTLITVLGTGFEVKSNANQTTVNVLEGKVKFSYQNQEVILIANQSATFQNKTHSIIKSDIQEENSLSYITGKLVFRNALMTEVVSALNSYYKNNEIQISESMAGCRLTATFDRESLDNVLKVIQITMSAEQTKDSLHGKYYLNGKGCQP